MYVSANVTQEPFVLAFHAARPGLVISGRSTLRILMKVVCLSTTLTFTSPEAKAALLTPVHVLVVPTSLMSNYFSPENANVSRY
jgi:hypothetical protein